MFSLTHEVMADEELVGLSLGGESVDGWRTNVARLGEETAWLHLARQSV